jgi:Ca2+-binding RTX toxin-like protein
MRKLAATVSVTAIAALALTASTSPAGAAVTIGQTAPPTTICADNADRLQPTVTSGNSYVVPATIATGTITSWSTEALAGAGRRLGLKVYRSLGGATYQVVGQAGPHGLDPGVPNTFPASVPVRAGDILGTTVEPTGGNPGCNFVVPGETYLTRTGNLAVGASGDFVPGSADRRQNISAVVESDCDNDGLGDETQDTNLSTCAAPGPGTGPVLGPGGTPVFCKGKPATIIGTAGSDVRVGSRGRDVIVGLGGNDRLSGAAGNDLICGGKGKDILIGGKGKDKLYGQKGKDLLKGKAGNDLCVGGPGNDTAKACEKTKSI